MQSVIGSGSLSLPKEYFPPIIETKKVWSEDWEYDPELEFVSGGKNAGGGQASTFEIQRRYGLAKFPHETTEATIHPKRDMNRMWIRVRMLNEQGSVETQIVGRVDNQNALMQGTSAAPSGAQRWVVSDGMKILKNIDVSESHFIKEDGSSVKVQWVPAMNVKDHRNAIVGNRSDVEDDIDGVFVHGNDEIWNHLEYVEYVLAKFVQQEDGPEWTVTGQIEILSQMETAIAWGTSSNVAEMLAQLIPVKYGVDYCVRSTDDGFEVFVFALVADEVSVAGVTMPKNPNVVRLDKDAQIDLIDVQIVESDEKRVDSIRVIGKQIVVCGTLRGVSAGDFGQRDESEGSDDFLGGSLVKKWPDELETEFIEAEDAGTYAEDKDAFRAGDRFKEVYQRLGAPVDWDLNGSTWAIECDLNGKDVLDEATYQNKVRTTLPSIPMKEGWDYTVDPPVPPASENLDGQAADLKAPLAWIVDQVPEDGGSPRYVQCDKVGIHVQKPQNDWGVILNASPNNKLAHGHWTPEQIATSTVDPRFNYETAIATIAILSDHRLQLGYDVPEAMKAGDGSVMTIVDEESEMHVLLPETILDLDTSLEQDNGEDFIKSPDSIVTLRNDAYNPEGVSRMGLILCGAIVRYINGRVKAQLTFAGHMPWGDLIGQILTVIQQGNDSNRVGAPITSVNWTVGKAPRTIIKTAYA